MKKNILSFFIFLLFTSSASALERISDYKDWTVFTHASNGEKMCFAVSRPKDKEPKNVRRGEVLFYVTSWKNIVGDGEVSIKIGYPFSTNSKPEIQIGAQRFRLFVKGDKAWVGDAKIEKQILKAMNRGATMLVTGVSKRGTKTSDRYSLSGVTAATRKALAECR